ncbi:MAG: HDOD domain-containing protein [Methylomonas sp.]|jgi:HD-like signal output (HDOD) protein
MSTSTNQAIYLQINKLKSLPALPEASLKIIAAINDPFLSTDKLAKVLALSPGVVSRILGLANSAYFGQPRSITDLSTAIYQVLGLDLVRSLTLGIIMNVHFDPRKCPAFDSKYFWMRSLVTAVAAQKIAAANRLNHYSSANIYTGGLLLYLGVLVLAYLMPAELDAIIHESRKQGCKVNVIIIREIGESHHYIGYILMHKWQLPALYQNVLKSFEDGDSRGEEHLLINLLKLSQRISSMLLDKREADIAELEQLGLELSVPTAGLAAIIEFLTDNHENIENLADIIGN